MADPLSITASAAGLVSLGIQVLSGITKYLDAVRERKDDVASAEEQVIRTRELLKTVSKVTAKIGRNHGTSAAFLRDSSSIQAELRALEEVVRNISATKFPSQTHDVLEKVHLQAKKLTYPFHRPTMDRLQSRLTRVNGMLQAALQVSMLDIAIDIEGKTAAIKDTLEDSTLSRQITEQLKHENIASRDALTRVGDSVVSVSSTLDQSLVKGLENIAASTTESLSVLNQGRGHDQIRLLQELSMVHDGVTVLNDTVKGVDVGVIKIREDIATTSTQLASLLRRDDAYTQAQMFQELVTATSGISGLSDNLKRVELALRALPTREELGRLISKPGELKDLCDVMEHSRELGHFQKFNHRSRIEPLRMICVCRKRVMRSRRALMWGPWQASADTSTTHDHFIDCACYYQGASATSKRWAVAFKGLRGLINRAIELSFTCSFGAGGCSLSPCFTYYPTVDRRRDPAFRIMSLFGWACLELDEGEPGIREFLEQCLKNLGLLYRHSRAAPRAVDEYGRGVLHYFAGISTRYMDQNTMLRELASLLKCGVQATAYDTYGSTPAWNITCLMVNAWVWDTPGGDTFEGPRHPSDWDSISSLSEFLCAKDPSETIVNQRSLELWPSEGTTMELFRIMKRSPATAEAFGCGALSLAALVGDCQKVELILANYPKAIYERKLLNQTPLHLAVGHASCVAVLLRGPGRSLIDAPDNGGRQPVEYAVFSCFWSMGVSDEQYHHGCSKSHGDTTLNILLDEGCMIPKRILWYKVFGHEFSICNNCLLVLSQHLVARRESLKMLAKSHLSEELAVELGVSSPYLLDSDACKVVQTLDYRGIRVPRSLQTHTTGENCEELTSVYHNSGPLPFSVLWELGFRDLDRFGMNGLTPLMVWCHRGLHYLTRCSWLIEKGASVENFVPCGASTIGHELYFKIGYLPPPRGLKDTYHDARKHVFDLTRRLSQQEKCDSCYCACSYGGCTPFVRFLHAVFISRRINSASEISTKLSGIIMETHKSVTKGQLVSAVRYATFEVLGIRHTCCHSDTVGVVRQDGIHFIRMGIGNGTRKDEESGELRQEDSSLITILDDLVAEFEEMPAMQEMLREQSDKECMLFWHNCWLPRVQEVLESLNSAEIEESEKVAAERIGVVWQMQQLPQSNDCDEEADSGSEDGRYHESDWDSDIDPEEMIDNFQTMGDWNSRLDLIMFKAGLSKLQAYD